MSDDIRQWLEDLDLGEYDDAFAENRVDIKVLPTLTSDDLKDIGVLAVGDRRNLLNAIALLAEFDNEATAEAAAPELIEALRRQVTVLFADISGFTTLSSQLDAEETHALLNRFFSAADKVVGEYGGTIDKHIGDAVMAVFGAPVAHTDDPERALRAALGIHEALATLEPPIRVHIGVASGQVVASTTGSAAHTEYTVTGDSVNLAARLTDMAKAGETLASASVQRALGERFLGDDLGERTVAGLLEPVSVWRLDELSATKSDSDHAFVGRARELGQFAAALAHASESRSGQTVIVRGEAGIGKTRLTEEFAGLARARGFTVHTGLVLDFGTAKGQDAVRALVRSLLELPPGSGKEARAQAADQTLNAGQVADERRVHLNDLLDLPQPPDLGGIYQAMDNETRNRGKQEALADLVHHASRQAPLLLRVEDAHWADRQILDHLAHLAKSVACLPVLLIVTTRISGDPLDQGWRAGAEGAALTTIDLGPLDVSEAGHLAKEFEGLDATLISACVERAGGNPLFLEQLLRNADELAEGDIPGTVQGIVQARLDTLPTDDREAIQAASVLGQRFSRPALEALLDTGAYDPANLLANVLIRPAGEELHFAHALIREGVYASMLRPRRTDLHRRAADWFFGSDPILHAEHLDKADEPGAAQAYLDAANQEAEKQRHERARQLVERAQNLVGTPLLQFDLAWTQGNLLRALGRTEDSIIAFQQSLELAQDDEQISRANIGLAGGMRIVNQYDDAFSALDEAQKHANGIDSHLAQIHHIRGNCHFPFGRSDECLEEQQTALEYARAAQLIHVEGQALSGISDALYASRRFSRWKTSLADCLEFAEKHQLSDLRASTLFMRATSSIWQLAIHDAVEETQNSTAIAVQIGDKRSEGLSEAVSSLALCYAADFSNAVAAARRAQMLFEEIGAQGLSPICLAVLAKAEFFQGRELAAETFAEKAVTEAKESSVEFFGCTSLGTLALVTRNPDTRIQALKEGNELLSGRCHISNYIEFRRDAAEIAVDCGDWPEALRQVEAWGTEFANDMPPYVHFWTSWIKALVQFGMGQRDHQLADELRRLSAEANSGSAKIALPKLEAALAEFGS